jgi:hypothetical protein
MGQIKGYWNALHNTLSHKQLEYINSATVTVTEKPKEKPVPTVVKNTPKYRRPTENPWGLMGHTLALYKWAADYYALTVMTIQEPKNETYRLMLDKKADKIADQFSRYTDMAVGGEIRHTPKSNYKFIVNKPMIEALEDGTIGHSMDGTGRHSAWNGWYWFRQRYGTVALKWVVEIFQQGSWGSSYGGMKWGDIANTLYMYEREEINKHIFIDTCWGLQHNGGVYFNKWWTHDLTKLQTVLTLNLKGEYCAMVDRHASQMIKKMFYEKIKESCLCSNH